MEKMSAIYSNSNWPDAFLEKDLINYLFFSNKYENQKAMKNSFCSIQKGNNTEEKLQRLLMWVIETVDELGASFQVKQRSIILINKYLTTEALPSDRFQLLAASALFLATKFEDNKKLTVHHLSYLCANQYRANDFHEMEMKILKLCKYNLTFPLPGDIIRFLINASIVNVNKSIFDDIDELITYALTTWELTEYPLNIIGISSLLYFLFFNQSEDVLIYLTKFIIQENIVEIKILEEFNTIFYGFLTDDQTFLAITKNYFKNFMNCHQNHCLSTPPKKESQFLEEEKSTVDTIPHNKYTSFFSETEPILSEVNIQPFTKMIEEKQACQEKWHPENANENQINDEISHMFGSRKF